MSQIIFSIYFLFCDKKILLSKHDQHRVFENGKVMDVRLSRF